MKDIFDQEYYESGNKSGYCGYYYSDMYPYFQEISRSLNTAFKPKTTLDVGCAKGYMPLAFKEIKVNAYGIDLSRYALLNAPKSIIGHLLIGNIDNCCLPFKNNSFDIVTMIEVLEHIVYYKQLLYEIKRILRPEGIVFITTPAKNIKGNYDISHVNVHSYKFWLNIFEQIGFKAIDPHIHKSIIKSVLRGYLQQPAGSKIGKVLKSFGNLGKLFRYSILYLDVKTHYYTNVFILQT